jgi:hypothetical protein
MNKRDWMIAAPVLCALAGCVAVFMHGVQVEASVGRIGALRALATPAGGRVAVVAAQALHVLDADGQRLARQELRTLGLQDAPNDMDLTVDEQGRLEAWFFEDAAAQPKVVRCAWDEGRRLMQQCATAAQGPQLKWSAQSRAVHLAIDRKGQRMFVADARSARVQVFDLAGTRVASSDPATLPLSFPNRLRYLGDDQLAVADNDHRRLLWAEFRSGAAPRLLSTLDAADHPQARPGRSKVTDAAFGPSGAIWMLAVKQGQKDGDVLVFDHARRPVARAALPEGADPLVVEALGETAIVADYSLVQLYRVDAAGRYLGEFGDVALRAELASQREVSLRAKMWTTGSLVAGGIVILAGLLLAWRYGSKPVPAVRQHAQAAAMGESGPSLQFPVVLDPTAPYRAALRKQAWALGALMVFGLVAMAALGVLGFARLKTGGLLGQLALSAVLMIATAWYFVTELLHPGQLRVTALRAGLFRNGRCIAEAPLAEVYASDRMILLGKAQVVYRMGGAQAGRFPPKYDLELLGRALLQRLPEAQLVDDMTLSKKRLARQPLWLKVLGLAGLVAAIAWVLKDALQL